MTRLERERRRRGWTQTDLAWYAHLTQSGVSLIERRRLVPTRRIASRLARVVGVSTDALFDEVA